LLFLFDAASLAELKEGNPTSLSEDLILGNFPRVSCYLNFSFTATACSPNFHKTIMLLDYLKKDEISKSFK
jgi:hypothetical protein